MAISFMVVIAPNVWWLVGHDFLPFQYVDAHAKIAVGWYQYISYPLQWVGSQAFNLLPAAALLAFVFPGAKGAERDISAAAAFDRRYVTWLALGPFLLTTFIAAALGRLVITRWGFPLWSFAPLAWLLWFKPATEMRLLQRFTAGFVAVFVAVPIMYAAVEIGEPFVRDRPKATQFSGRALADIVTRDWHRRFDTPLIYVGGNEFLANNIAVYSPDRPHVIVHAQPELSPWIDKADLRRRGAVLVWRQGLGVADIEKLKATYGDIDIQPELRLPRQTWYPRRPNLMGYAVVPPRP